jgi:hypothetical protein
MKTILRILSVLAIMFFIACSEDIYLHDGKDGTNGHDGPKGDKGDRGFPTLMYFDSTTQTRVYYLDIDSSWTLTLADTILYEELKEGYKIVPNGKCYDIFNTIGTKEYLIGTVCNGEKGDKGDLGDPGKNSIVIMSIIPDTISCKSGLRVILVSLQDNDTISSLSFCVPADGDNGKNGKTIIHKEKCFDFNQGTTCYYDSIGFKNSHTGEGEDQTIWFDFSCSDTAVVLIPEWDNASNLDFLCFIYGGNFSVTFESFTIAWNGEEKIIASKNYPGNPCFNKDLPATYEQFNFIPEETSYSLKRIGFRAIKLSGLKCTDIQFHIDNVCYGWSWEE